MVCVNQTRIDQKCADRNLDFLGYSQGRDYPSYYPGSFEGSALEILFLSYIDYVMNTSMCSCHRPSPSVTNVTAIRMDSDAQKKTKHLNPYTELTTTNAKVRSNKIHLSWRRSQQRYRLQFSTNLSNPFTPTYVTSNLSLSSDPAGMYVSRVKGRQILLENPARESRAIKELEKKQMRKRRDKEKKKQGIIGKREAKEKGVWTFDKAQAKFVFLFSCGLYYYYFFWNSRFDLFLPLHHLWMGYMSELLGLSREPSGTNTSAMAKSMPNSASMHPKLLKADFHGSIMTGL